MLSISGHRRRLGSARAGGSTSTPSTPRRNDLKARAVVAAAVVDAAFAGQISTLTSIAEAPAVVAQRQARDARRTSSASKRGTPPFNGGLGWIDKRGELEVSSNGGAPGPSTCPSGRTSRRCSSTGKPYVSSGLIGRRNGQQVIVTAVATRDASGRISGVLAGSTRVKAIGQNKASLELGYAGLSIVDRSGQAALLRSSPTSRTRSCCGGSRGRNGVLTGTRGLNDSGGHIVAFASATGAGLDDRDRPPRRRRLRGRPALARPRARVGRGGGARSCSLLLAFVWRRSRRQTSAYEARARAWSGLTRTLAAAATPEDVADGLIGSLVEAFPGGLPVVSLVLDDGALRVRSPNVGRWARVRADDSALAQIALYAQERRRDARVEREPLLHEVHRLSGRRLRWLYGLPIANPAGDVIGSLALRHRRRARSERATGRC